MKYIPQRSTPGEGLESEHDEEVLILKFKNDRFYYNILQTNYPSRRTMPTQY